MRWRTHLQGKLHLTFPGLFNECWLYVNGEEVAHRPFKGVWWMNDDRFEWDVDIAGKLQPGKNSIVVRHFNPAPLRRRVPPAIFVSGEVVLC